MRTASNTAVFDVVSRFSSPVSRKAHI